MTSPPVDLDRLRACAVGGLARAHPATADAIAAQRTFAAGGIGAAGWRAPAPARGRGRADARPSDAELTRGRDTLHVLQMRRRPKTKRGLVLAIGGGLVLLAVVAFAVIYFVAFPTSSPKPFSLTASKVATPVKSGTKLNGSWKIASGSEAGYRVREKLGFLPAESDAVGRTSSITGRATVTEVNRVVTITAASFRVAVNTLKSDRSMRDQRIHSIGLQSDSYPTATFVLSSPLALPASALSGHVAHVSVTGVFDIHGTSRRETVPLEVSLSNTAIDAVGSLTFPWSEFNMTAPSIGGFVNVTNKATTEFDLRLQRG